MNLVRQHRLWAVIAALVAAVVVTPLLRLPLFEGRAHIWIGWQQLDGNMAKANADVAESIARDMTPAKAHELLVALPSPPGTPAIPEAADLAGVALEVQPDASLQIVYAHHDPAVAARVVNGIGLALAEVYNMSSLFDTPAPVANAAVLAQPGDGWLLVACLLTLVSAALVLVGLGRRREGWLVPLALAIPAAALVAASLARSTPTSLLALGVAVVGAVLAAGWRGLLIASTIAASVQGGAFDALLPTSRWTILQLAPLAIAGVWLCRWWPRGRRPSRPEWASVGLAAALACFAGASALWSAFPTRSLAHAGVLAAYLGFFVLLAWTRWRDADVVIADLGALVTSCSVLLGVGFVTWLTGWAEWPLSPAAGRFQSFWYNPNGFGLAAAALLLVALAVLCHLGMPRAGDGRWWARLGWAAGAGTIGISLVLCGSRGSLLGALAGIAVLVVALGGRRTAWVAGLGGVVGLAVLVPVAAKLGMFERQGATGVDSGRFALWQEALSRFASSPLIGVGHRTGTAEGPTKTYHNFYLSVLAELGIVGLLLFLGVVVCALLLGRHGRPALIGAVAAVAVAELVDSQLFGFFGPATVTAWLALTAHAALGRRSGKAEPAGATLAPLP